MSTRQRRNSKLHKLLFPVFCGLLCLYFIHHANTGRFGLEAQARMTEQTHRLEKQLASLRLKREGLASRVRLLQDGNIERDMLDEQARYHLNLLHTDEIVIMRSGN